MINLNIKLTKEQHEELDKQHPYGTPWDCKEFEEMLREIYKTKNFDSVFGKTKDKT